MALRLAVTFENADRQTIENAMEKGKMPIAEIMQRLEGGTLGKDAAMNADNVTRSETTPVGGINLNPKLLDMQIRRDGNGVPLPLPQQPIKDFHIEGFIPIIINVTPVSNLPFLLGFDADTDTKNPNLTSGDDQRPEKRKIPAREPEEVSLLK